MKADTKLLLIGCGKMGGALLQRLAGKLTAHVVDPALPHPALKALSNITWGATPDKIDPSFKSDIVILALKPQHMAKALPPYAHLKTSVFLSIAAGVTIAALEKLLSSKHAVVRSMPNLPASIGQAMSVAVANHNVTPMQHDLCDEVLKTIGETAWINEEPLIDAVTALSGSGPGYIFALCEAMTKAGTELGLPLSLATLLARQTIIGSSGLLAASHESAASLRTSVTSPGGTTEAALKILLAPHGLDDVMLKAMAAAFHRAKELARLA